MRISKAAQYHHATNTRIYLENDGATNTKTPQMTRPHSLLNGCIHELPKGKRERYRDDANSTSCAQKQTSAPGCYKAWGSVGTRVSADLSPGNIYCIKETADDDLSMKQSLKSFIPSRKIGQRHTCNHFYSLLRRAALLRGWARDAIWSNTVFFQLLSWTNQ